MQRMGGGMGMSRMLASPSILAMFASGEAGAFYDTADLSTMYQDSAGTTAAVVGQPVGRINDKSGRGNHATQATTAAQPILRQDSNGNYYLEFAGHRLSATFVIAQPWDRVSAIRQITSSTSGARLFGDGNVANNMGVLYQGTSPEIVMFNGFGAPANSGLAIGVNGVVTERGSGASSRLAVNNGAYVTGDSGPNAPQGITIGNNSDGGNPSSIHFYGAVMIGRALTDAEITRARSYFAQRAGVTL